MKKRHKWLALLLALAGALLAFGVVYAYGTYRHYGYEISPPDYGTWWWTNGTRITFETTHWWDTDSRSALVTHYFLGDQPTFEIEAYDPGQQTECDRIYIYSVTIWNLPVDGYEIKNGDCPGNNQTYKEQVDIFIRADYNFQAQVWYDHWEKYNKISGGGEINVTYEFGGLDLWLAKVEYNGLYNATCTSPAGFISGVGSC